MAHHITIRDALCTSFALQAMQTWNFLAEGHAYKLLPGEETITDVNLIELKRRHQDVIHTEKYSRYREGTVTGADWEWWISDAQGWIGLRIQAKKLDPQTGRYEAFVSNPLAAQAQAEMLMDASKDGPEDLYPVYCFYNCWWFGVPSSPCRAGMDDLRVFGCALASARTVHALVNQGRFRFSDFAPHLVPWSCLFCGEDPGGDPLLFAVAAQQRLDRHLFSDDLEDRGRLENEPPEYVEAAWRIGEQLPPGEVDPDAFPDLSHVLVTSSLLPPPA